jgi:hypothetical protein
MTVGSVSGFGFSPNYAVDQTAFAATSNVFKSTDGGLTWESVLNRASSSLAFSPNYASDHILIAGTNAGVWKTTTGGNNWVDISTNLPSGAKSILVVVFPPNYPNDPTVFAGTRDAGLYKATDINTPTWTLAGSGSSINTKKSRIISLVFSPNFAVEFSYSPALISFPETGFATPVAEALPNDRHNRLSREACSRRRATSFSDNSTFMVQVLHFFQVVPVLAAAPDGFPNGKRPAPIR